MWRPAMPSSRMPALLVADPSGKVLEHPRLLAPVRSGEELLLPPEPEAVGHGVAVDQVAQAAVDVGCLRRVLTSRALLVT